MRQISEINGNPVNLSEGENPITGEKHFTLTVEQPHDWQKTPRRLGGVAGAYARRFKTNGYDASAVPVEWDRYFEDGAPMWTVTYRVARA